MSAVDPNRIIDPNFPDYAYTCKTLVSVYDGPANTRKKIANVLIGEWMKILSVQENGWVQVMFRGGQGYVEAANLGRQRFLEIFFIDVDQGDSILIQTPDDRRILIDGGMTLDAHNFIRNKYRLDKPDNYIDFEAIVITHSDEDHASGLIPILKDPKILVKRIYHNGLFRTTEGADPGPHSDGRISGLVDTWPPADYRPTELMRELLAAAQTAKAQAGSCLAAMSNIPRWQGRLDFDPADFVFERIDMNNGYLPPYDNSNPHVQIEALWPRALGSKLNRYYPWYGSPGYTVNGNSVVLRVKHGQFSILLTGDLNEKAMDDLIKAHGQSSTSKLRADVYKAAHHGSQHFSVPFCKAVAANASVVMSGDNANDAYGHPRAVLLGTINRYSRCATPAVFCTELAACFRKLQPAEQQVFDQSKEPLYEKSIQGVVHLRSSGEQLCLGTVHGRKTPDDPLANVNWKWDIWTNTGKTIE